MSAVHRPGKHIVFDLAHVIFTWDPQAMLMRLLPHVASSLEQAAHWDLAIFENWLGDWAHFDRGAIGVDEIVDRIARRTGLMHADVMAVVQQIPHELQPMPASVALLHTLADADHPVHYLSNMPAPYAALLEQHPFFARFASGIFSGRVGHNKPEPGIYALAEALFAPADRLVFLDDNADNVAAAQARGWNALVFHDAAQAAAAMRTEGWAAA